MYDSILSIAIGRISALSTVWRCMKCMQCNKSRVQKQDEKMFFWRRSCSTSLIMRKGRVDTKKKLHIPPSPKTSTWQGGISPSSTFIITKWARRSLLFNGPHLNGMAWVQDNKFFYRIPSVKLTANARENRPGPKRNFIFQPVIFRAYVSFRECSNHQQYSPIYPDLVDSSSLCVGKHH